MCANKIYESKFPYGKDDIFISIQHSHSQLINPQLFKRIEFKSHYKTSSVSANIQQSFSFNDEWFCCFFLLKEIFAKKKKKLIKRRFCHTNIWSRSPSKRSFLNGFSSCSLAANNGRNVDKLFSCKIDSSLIVLKQLPFQLPFHVVCNDFRLLFLSLNGPLLHSTFESLIILDDREIWIKGNYCSQWQNICSIVAQSHFVQTTTIERCQQSTWKWISQLQHTKRTKNCTEKSWTGNGESGN